MKIAIVGATSHIAKNLIIEMASEHQLYLFARNTQKTNDFIIVEGIDNRVKEVLHIDTFGQTIIRYDAVINCVGFGKPNEVRSQSSIIQVVTERYDNLIIDYLSKYPKTIYINFSSGAVYGTELSNPVSSTSEFRIRLDSITDEDAYRVAKLNSETKHRSLSGFSIIDLRVFNFFSRYIDISSSFLITEIMEAIKNGEEFVTLNNDFIRDYVHPEDLINLVQLCLRKPGINRSIDVYSCHPVKKSEIIAAFRKEFGLRVRYISTPLNQSPTGMKTWYVSENHDAESIFGYFPKYSSIDALLEIARKIFFK